MKTKTKLLCSSFLLSLIIMLPATVRAESEMPLYDRTKKLFDQIKDLELMQRNIEEFYQGEKRPPMVARLSGQSWRDLAELDGKLMNRVFGHLAGFPEYERFIIEYGTVIQRPDYRRLHPDELFAEYMRLLESGRIRFRTQLKEWLERLAEKCSAQAHEGLAQSIPVKTVTFGHAEGSQRTESGRVVPASWLQVQMPLSGSTPLAMSPKSVSRIVVHGTDQSGSAGTAVPTVDTSYWNEAEKKNGPQIADTKVGAASETNAVDQILEMPIVPTTVGGFPYQPKYQGGKQKTLRELLGTKTVTTPSP